MVATGDYQPAKRKLGLSRQMLEACLELGFPVFVLERSPLVLRDLDLLQATNELARVVMIWTIIQHGERGLPPPEMGNLLSSAFSA
jgi:DNA repair photolyase